jgi:hypothetical protein
MFKGQIRLSLLIKKRKKKKEKQVTHHHLTPLAITTDGTMVR